MSDARPAAQPILVTGGTGQLASALAAAGGVGGDLFCVGRPEFDFDRPESIEATFHAAAPGLVINAAAYTAVDAAENHADAAYRANRDGPAILARLCAQADVPLIHISTDYVFDGAKPGPYVETDPVNPQGVYGASKLAGEQAVMASGAKVIILRTAWVYAATGKNFVRTMLNLGKTRDRLTVVADQFGCPTTAADLSAAILAIVARLDATGWQPAYRGIFHVRGSRPPRRQGAGGRAHRHPRLSDAGEPSGQFPARLHTAARCIWHTLAAMARQPDPHGRRNL
jgi:dTDP-4-dehydrorhamnose reductase